MTKRHELTDAQWEKIKPLLPPEKPKTGRTNHDHRTLLNGMICRAKTGTPWRDLPERYGKWKTVYSRRIRWRDAGVWQRVWEALQQDANREGEVTWEIHFIDSTIVRAHQHAAGAKKCGGNRSLQAKSGWVDTESPCAGRWQGTTVHVWAHARSAARRNDG